MRILLNQRWFRFCLIGLLATVSYFFLGLLFVSLLKLPLLVGNALSYLLSFAISYLGQSRWTFQVSKKHKGMLPRYAATQAFGLLLNSIIVEVLCGMAAPYALAMLAAIALVPFAVYLLCKYWVFFS